MEQTTTTAAATTPQTVEDLGRLVKSKYPGQYDDMDDHSVGTAVKTKFPTDYADFQDVVKSTSHGASGAWEPNSKVEQFQIDHPLLSSPVTALARMGKGAVDAATGTVSGLYHAVTDPLTPEEQSRPLTPGASRTAATIGHRLLIDPQKAEQQKADEADTGMEAFGHGLAAKLPMAGPYAAHIGELLGAGQVPEAIGEGLFGVGMGALLDEVKAARNPLTPKSATNPVQRAISERQLNAFSSVIKSGVGEDSVHQVAETALPVFQRAAAERGTTLEQPLKEKFPTRATIPNDAGKRAVRTAGEEAIEIANHAVDIANRPFEDVLRQHGPASTNPVQFGNMKTPQVQATVLDKLEAFARENDKVNQPLADATRALAERVQANGGTFNGLNDLKVLANKKSSPLFNKSLGAQLNASADVAYAWKFLGDAIRSEAYPELSRLSGVDLREAGATEAAVMDARDGVRQNYYKEVLPAHAQQSAMTYFENLKNGSLYKHNFLSRALGLRETPAGAFNNMFRRSMGANGGQQIPAMPGQVPFYPGPNPNLKVPDVVGTQQDLLPTGAVDSEPLLAPPPGTANTRNGVTGSTMAEDIFRVQQRANQAARSAPPETIAGTQPHIAESALPASPPAHPFAQPGAFFPGKSHLEATITDLHGRPVPNAHGMTTIKDMYGKDVDVATDVNGHVMKTELGHPIEVKQDLTDYSQQGQLFSVDQSRPPAWHPSMTEASSTTELVSVADEIGQYLKNNNPPPTMRKHWQDNLDAIQNEIMRRRAAMKTPSDKMRTRESSTASPRPTTAASDTTTTAETQTQRSAQNTQTQLTPPPSASHPRSNLYRQAHPDELLDFLPGSPQTSNSINMQDIYMHSNKDLALGQNLNKDGVMLEFDPTALKMSKSMKKPGAAVSESIGGGAEYIAKHNDQQMYQDALRKVTLPAEIKGKTGRSVVIKRLLDKLGWEREVGKDGSITYTKPTSAKRASGTTPQ